MLPVVSNILVGLVGLFHIGFFVLERFIWNQPLGWKIFKITEAEAKSGSVLAANQGVYNLLLALILFGCLLVGKNTGANSVKVVVLIFIIFVGIYGTVTVGRNILFMQVLPSLLALLFVMVDMANPRLNDVVTSKVSVPKFEVIAQRQTEQNYEYPQDFYQIQQDHYPDVVPVVIGAAPATVFGWIERLLDTEYDWKVVVKDKQRMRVEATATTRYLRFKDDIVIEVHQHEGPYSRVEIRSRSRSGKSDFRINAKRIEALSKRLRTISHQEQNN